MASGESPAPVEPRAFGFRAARRLPLRGPARVQRDWRDRVGVVAGGPHGVRPRDDERLSGVLNDTRILARLVEDLRTLANAESGNLTLHKEPTDLAMLARDVMSSFPAGPLVNSIAMRVDAAADLPLVEIDP